MREVTMKVSRALCLCLVAVGMWGVVWHSAAGRARIASRVQAERDEADDGDERDPNDLLRAASLHSSPRPAASTPSFAPAPPAAAQPQPEIPTSTADAHGASSVQPSVQELTQSHEASAELAAAAQPTGAEPRSSLESQWNGEPHDATQSTRMQADLQEAAKALDLPPDVVRSADCGSDVCKVRLAFGSVGDALKFQQGAHRPDLSYEVKSTATADPSGLVAALDPESVKRALASVQGQAPGAGSTPVGAPVELELLIGSAANAASASKESAR
jgi:hypothetical protein